MAIGTLYVEELKATMRGRFAWLGAGVILLAIGGVATVGTQDTWLDGYGIIAYFLVPLAFIPLAAVFARESAGESVRRERLHRSGRTPRLVDGENPGARHACRRLLRGARPDDAGLYASRRRAAAPAEVADLGAMPARRRASRSAR